MAKTYTWIYEIQLKELVPNGMQGVSTAWKTHRTVDEIWKAQSIVEAIARELPEIELRVLALLGGK